MSFNFKKLFASTLLLIIFAVIYFKFYSFIKDNKQFTTKNGNKQIESNFPWTDLIENQNDPIEFDVLLFVSSSKDNSNRRKMIRDTWWKDCPHLHIKCLFATDKLNESLEKENIVHKDMIFMPDLKKVRFGQRFLFMLLWSQKRYRFKWFLRIDDDVFIYLPFFLMRLPDVIDPKINHFIYGHLHCVEFITRVDESVLLLSWATFQSFVMQPLDQILCHPLADQQIAIWVNQLKLGNIWFHNHFYSHYVFNPSNKKYFFERICQPKSIHAIHKITNVEDMNKLYENCKTLNHTIMNKMDLFVSHKCKLKNEGFKWMNFGNPWIYEPLKCISNPIWTYNGLLNNQGKYIHPK